MSFPGPIRNSHCPLVIGGFIKDRVSSYFQGYMDNVRRILALSVRVHAPFSMLRYRTITDHLICMCTLHTPSHTHERTHARTHARAHTYNNFIRVPNKRWDVSDLISFPHITSMVKSIIVILTCSLVLS